MANNYYTFTPQFVAGTLVRSSDMNVQLAALEAAFDLLPVAVDSLPRGVSTFAGSTAGSGNAFTVTLPNTRLTNQNGDEVVFIANRSNTGATTLNVDGIGAVPLVNFDGLPLVAGDLTSGLIHAARYDSANARFQLTTPFAGYTTSAAASAAAAAVSAAAALVSEGAASDSADYAAEWANKAEDSLVSAAAGGDQVNDYSALHWAAKAADAAATIISGLYFAGTHDASGGDPATPSANNPVYRITVAGTLTGAGAVSPGDDVYWDGVDWARVKNVLDAGDVGFTQLAANVAATLAFFNGMCLDVPSLVVSSNGSTISLTVEKSGGGDLRVLFSSGVYAWDCTPAASVNLSAGSDSSPQINYVYLLESNLTLTASTTGWPAAEHLPVAKVLCQSAATLQNDDAYLVHSFLTKAVAADDQGHLSHLDFWVHSQPATWQSGAALTPTITTNGGAEDNVDIAVSSGTILTLHRQTFPAFDTGTGSTVYLVNKNAAAYTKITDLNAADQDDAGNAIADAQWTNLVIWGVVNDNSAESKLFINLPSGFHATAGAATADAEGYSNYTIPAEYKGVGFLIARLTLKYNTAASGTWAVEENLDLRDLAVGGGGGGGGVEFADNAFRILDDADATSKLAFDVSAIATATTRTLTVPDANVNLGALGIANLAFANTDRLFGRDTAGAGAAEEITVGGGLEFNGSGGIQRSALTGDVTAAAGSNTTALADNTVDLAELAHATQGDLLYWGATGVPARLGAGTSGFFLKTQGPGADPVWAAGYSHPNHTGQVTSTGDGATVLADSSITAQNELASGLVGTDELLVSDGGVLKRMDVDVLFAYLKTQDWLFSTPIEQNHNELSARSSGIEAIDIGDYQSYYLPIGGNSVTIDINTANTGTGAKFISGRMWVHMNGTYSGLSVTTDVTGAIIKGTAPSTSGADAFLFWEYQRTSGGTERLWVEWLNEA